MKARCNKVCSPYLGLMVLAFCFVFVKNSIEGTIIKNVQSRDFSPKELKEDFLQMRKIIEDLHPALYEFTDEDTFSRIYEQQYTKISQTMPLEEFYRRIIPIVNRIGCGHSNLWMPEGWLSQSAAKYFPLKLCFIRNKAYVIEKNDAIPTGSQILSINGHSASKIIKQILAAISSDGLNPSYRMKRMEKMFPYQFAKQFGFANEFIVRFVPFSQSETKETILPYAGYSAVRPKIVGKQILKKELIGEKDTAILKINNFIYYDQNEKFFSFIDSSFKAFAEAGITNLILDLRGNDGGDPFCAAHLFSYLASGPVPYFSKPYGKYAKLAAPIPLAEYRFSGNLFILIDGMCFSTTGHLTSLLKYHRIGTFVGTETGGTYTCNDATKQNALKNTKIQLWVARRSFATAVKGMPKDHGILPDFVIEPNIADLVKGKDTVLEYTLSLIQKN